MKKHVNRICKKRRMALCLVMVFFFLLFLVEKFYSINENNEERPEGIVSADENVLENPRIVVDAGMESGQKVTWDCVWFGSYPQAEVITAAMQESYGATLKAAQIQKGDLIIDDTVYADLQSADAWDEKGDITLEDGTKYRRMKREDAVNVVKGKENYYNWEDGNTYHYFKYQPIKWRVLSTDGSKAFLLSDKVLDGKQYSDGGSTTWETSSLRRWLNGYGSDYLQSDGKNFMNSAFTSQEQEAILDTTVKNDDNIEENTKGGNDTIDKLFLLSEAEVYFDADMAGVYGFASQPFAEDEARQAKSSTYAKAMGAFTAQGGNANYWLRSPGEFPEQACSVWYSGGEWSLGYPVEREDWGVRPALYVNLNTSSALYSYAGTRCSEEARYRLTGSDAAEAVYVRGVNKKNVTIPDMITIEGESCTVTSVDKTAFEYIHKVKSITIGSYITVIPRNVFYYREKLKEIIIKSENLQAVGKDAIRKIAKDAVIKVPEGKGEEYKKLFTAKTGYKKTMKIVEYDKAAYEEEQKAAENKTEENQAAGDKSLANPSKKKDVSMSAGQKVTWDCVWFGSYPQAEVITTKMKKNYTAVKDTSMQENDLVIDDAVYAALKEADDWDSNGDIILDGEKYRRIKKKDTFPYDFNGTRNMEFYGSYNWAKTGTWHYFKYEPIKWRVLSTDGKKALLLSDKILDNQKYNTKFTKTTWETSTIRSWLNGYGASANSQKISYKKKNFYDSAFNPDEKRLIRKTSVVNANYTDFVGRGGNNTIDKLFLLSAGQVFDSKIADKNFVGLKTDEALQAKGSTYAKAMGVHWSGFVDRCYEENCYWWLRSPGFNRHYACSEDSRGYLNISGWDVNGSLGVRVALYLNLDAASELYSYAGTRCSDEVHYRITSSQEKEAAYLGSEVENTAIIPAEVMLEGEIYKVTSIAKGAFDGYGGRIYYDDEYDYEDYGIWFVTIGSNVTSIGKNAFRKCEYLEEITIESENLQEIGKNAFKGIAKDALIKVPEGKGEEYKKLFTAKTGYKKTMEIVEISLQ